MDMQELFGEVISTYTRAQAIEDGVLVDLMQEDMADIAREHFKHPIACTASVWSIMQRAVENKRHCNDYAGVLHDMLWMARNSRNYLNESTVLFEVIITGASRKKYYTFKMVCGPGDDAAPVMTVMLPEED
jgi:hypothetical protein